MKNNILVIAAHPDDEVLGAGGTILKHIKNKDKVTLVILSEGETSRGNQTNTIKRLNQARKVSQLLGINNLYLEKLPDNEFDRISLLTIVKTLEKFLYSIRPNIIYTHNISDLNIDHQITAKSVITACRPQPQFFVKKILSFEILSSTEWQFAGSFCPNEFVNITDYIEKKIRLVKIYEDEVRKYPHPRSLEGIKILAKYRGMQVGYHFAEAFQIIRYLN